MIILQRITKKAGGRLILDIPKLEFQEGRRYALIGENGSGKTTLLRVMAGILAPDSGKISGLPLPGMGYLPQVPYGFGFSVRRNVEMALQGEKDAPKHAMAAIKAVGLTSLADARGHKLSGGETQRMALARLVAKPRPVLLLDEPTSATDIRGMDLVEALLLRYARQTGCTLIFSTHSPAQALRLAKEVIFLEHGRVVEQGPAARVLKIPQSEATKLFLQHWRI
jgi:ABC-type multidrug transport system ATPase subunit